MAEVTSEAQGVIREVVLPARSAWYTGLARLLQVVASEDAAAEAAGSDTPKTSGARTMARPAMPARERERMRRVTETAFDEGASLRGSWCVLGGRGVGRGQVARRVTNG